MDVRRRGARTYLAATLTAKHEGARGTTDHRVRVVSHSGDVISAWHDIPLRVKDSPLLNFVAEIPKGEKAKYEISTTEAFNPIKFDLTKTGEPRFYPFASLVNYGALPQTWEDPAVADSHLSLNGDNDPLDVCEIGSQRAQLGEVYPVKPLGVLGMLDEGEVDWKIIAIRATDPLADQLHGMADVRRYYGTRLEDLVKWFRVYKIPDGKPENEFGFDGEIQDVDLANEVVDVAHDAWRALIEKGEAEKEPTYGLGVLKAASSTPLWAQQRHE